MIEHVPVLLEEVLEHLGIQPDGIYLDATVGLGGHAGAILKCLGREGRLIGLDQDEEALAEAAKKIGEERVTLLKGNFEEMSGLLRSLEIGWVNGILMDLGVSSLQLMSGSRGFSFNSDAPLDMRMDAASELTAAGIVNHYPEKQLADLIFDLGQERRSRRIARAIVRARPLATCRQLADLIGSVNPRRGRLHPATRTFQALRMAVNRELVVLEKGLRQAVSLLRPGGRLCVISYHSGEDRIVKETFRILKGRLLAILTPKPVVPSRREVDSNPRSRSAKLRVAERLDTDDLVTEQIPS